MKRLGLLWVATIYTAALLWGMTGAGAALVVGCLVFLAVFPRYVQVDPCDTTSALDHLDGVGGRR